MSDSQLQTSIQQVRSTILKWLEDKLPSEKTDWLKTTGQSLIEGVEDWKLFTSFSAVPRYVGKEKADLTEGELKVADEQRKGWNPESWTFDQLGRSYLLLCYAEHGKVKFLDALEKIFVTSDMGEAIALYQGLCIYPWPEELKLRTAEGLRSNITPVFNAIALDNPYPPEYLDQDPYNQIVLKALFVESPLYRIIGLGKRANATLAKICVEYSQERRSAGRSVSPELWRNVGPFINDDNIDDIKWVLNQPDDLQQQAGVLALLASTYHGKEKLLEQFSEVLKTVEKEEITWNDIGRKFEAMSN